MDWRTYCIVLLTSMLFAACGQVGTITGGPKDQRAPQPVVEEMEPSMASTNVQPATITIPFDEFIQLNKPKDNIRVSPQDVQLDYTIKKRSLVLTLAEGDWKDSTTYSINLNRAVQDITEKNDSVFEFVFATGDHIDSLQMKLQVQDAFTDRSMEEITVGLFDSLLLSDTANISPRYMSITDENGIAQFNYLQRGPYYAYAFQDENKNNQLDPDEARGKFAEPLLADTLDSLQGELQLMPPEPGQLRVTTNELISPGIWAIGWDQPVQDTGDIAYLGTPSPTKIWNSSRDSLLFLMKDNASSGTVRFALQRDTITDTISKRFFFKELPALEPEDNLSSGKLLAGDTLTLRFQDGIKNIDTSRIQLNAKSASDTLFRPGSYTLKQTQPHLIEVIHDRKDIAEIQLEMHPGALRGEHLQQKDSIQLKYSVGQPKDLGALIVTLDSIPPYGWLHVLNRRGDVVRKARIDGKQEHTFRYMQPGKYSYYFLVDRNKDGRWNTGSIFTEKEPERVIRFEQVSTVRANWEVETELSMGAALLNDKK
ncbi:MAG: Ig-like domain-containing protein [Bacteroidota bacterium]